MPRASAEAAAETAHRVLRAAAELFASAGYAGVSVEDVAHAARVTRGAVYHHYGNKTGLFRAVAADAQRRVAAAVVQAAEETGDDPITQLRAGSHAFVDAITAAPVTRILLLDAPAVLGWTQWRDLDEANSVVHLREALAAAGVPDELLEATTVQLSGAMNETALWLARQPDGSDAHEAAHRALDRLLSSTTA